MDFTSHDGAQHRQQRLRKALQIASDIAGLTPAQADSLIYNLHDDRGTLRVTWRTGSPSDIQRIAFATAWRLAGEREDAIEHISRGV